VVVVTVASKRPAARERALAVLVASVLLAATACGLEGPVDVDATGSGGGTASHVAHATSNAAVGPTNAATGGGFVPNVPPTFTVTGRVVDQDGEPVAAAIVLQAGRSDKPTLTSGSDGSFTVPMVFDGLGLPTVVASKQGYRTAGLEFLEVPSAPVELVLHAARPPDNEAYVYGKPGKGKDPSTAYCGHCHDTLAAEFQTSKHAGSARNPLLQSLYAGVSLGYGDAASCEAVGGRWLTGHVPGTASDAAARCYLGGGVLPDLNPGCDATGACDDPALAPSKKPKAFGACADCHAPGLDGKAGDRDLLEAVGVGYEDGVHCDFCHKVADVELALAPGAGKRLRVQRPSETYEGGPPGGKLRQVMFGPLVDVPNPNMGGSVAPVFATATFCAGCHEATQGALVPGTSLAPAFAAGLPVHTTFSEWLSTPYATGGMPCQRCHMPASDALDSSTDLGTAETASITYGFPRPPEQLRRHIFQSPLVALSPGSLRLVDTALTPTVTAKVESGALDVAVSVANVGCGHAVPTGEPMRAVLLVVEARCNGEPLVATGGATIDDVGGAKAIGRGGVDATTNAQVLSWSAGASAASPGDVVRVVKPSGTFLDYPGVPPFDALAASDKGLPLLEPRGQATVLAVAGATLTLDRALPLETGDLIYLGELLATEEGQPSRALAGVPGLAFARVLVDPQGRRQAPHHRAVDVARDNRILPTKPHGSTHRFALSPSCDTGGVVVRARLLYRPRPLHESTLRGWDARDHRIGETTLTLPLP